MRSFCSRFSTNVETQNLHTMNVILRIKISKACLKSINIMTHKGRQTRQPGVTHFFHSLTFKKLEHKFWFFFFFFMCSLEKGKVDIFFQYAACAFFASSFDCMTRLTVWIVYCIGTYISILKLNVNFIESSNRKS